MISVLVPYRPDGGHRDAAWAWNRQRWEAMPDVELVVHEPAAGAHPGEFNHPYAINRAAERATSDVLIVADADTAFNPAWVQAAAAEVKSGRAPWALPRYYDKLTEASTAALLARDPIDQMADPIWGYEWEWRGDSVCWSGLVVVPRAAFELVGGYDERFEYWGADDVCFGLTMDALWGRHHRLEGAAMHLWHPAPAEQTYGHERHPEQDALMRRYTENAEDSETLKKVRFS